ncbi:MAG: ASCH domain-containing protein [Mycoplasma sp.]
MKTNVIILPIKSIYVKEIFNGNKKYEYRTKIPTNKIEKILIYETAPMKKIVGEIIISSIWKSTPTKIWNLTNHFAGIKKEHYFEYFKNKEVAYAYQIKEFKKYKQPKELKDFGFKNPPQNFFYAK